MIKEKMTKINISSLIKNQTKNDSSFKNFVLNINVKDSKILSNLFFIFVFISFATLMFATLIIIQQLKDLQTQMQSLRLMYQDSNQCNHVDVSNRFHRSVDYNDFVNSIISSTFKLNQTEVKIKTEVKDNKKIITLKLYNEIILHRSDYEKNTIKRNASNLLDIKRSLSKFMSNLFFNSNNRQNLHSEKQNYMTEDEVSSDHGLKWIEPRTKRLRRDKESSKEQQNEEKGETWRQSEEENKKWLQIDKESNKQRQNEEKHQERHQSEERSEKRRQRKGKNQTQRQNEKKIEKRYSKEKGEKRRQNRRRNKHNRKRLSPLVATFVGEVPEVKITGNIGPWIKINNNNHNESHQYDFQQFYLVEDNMSIQICISGLYMISVQISYFGDPMNHSYWILLNSEGSSNKEKLVKCATACSGNEVSCYTSAVRYLKKGDRLSLQQQEKNRNM